MSRPLVHRMVFTGNESWIASADYNKLGKVYPYAGGGFTYQEITDNAGAWIVYAAGKYGTLPAGSRVYLDLETQTGADSSAAVLTALVNDTKTALPNCLVGSYFLPVTDAGAVGGGRTATIEARNDAYATTIDACQWVGSDYYHVDWQPPPGEEELNWNVNECLRARRGKPLSAFITHTHATGGALTTYAEFVATLKALRRGRIDDLTLWANITSSGEGADFVAQLPVLGAAITAVWGTTRRDRGFSRGR